MADVLDEDVKLDTVSAARRLGVAPATLLGWRSGNKGPPYLKLGGKVLYRAADLDAWLTERTVRPGTSAAV